jgi:hypothetical protein
MISLSINFHNTIVFKINFNSEILSGNWQYKFSIRANFVAFQNNFVKNTRHQIQFVITYSTKSKYNLQVGPHQNLKLVAVPMTLSYIPDAIY